MAFITPRMSLKVWNSSADPYSHEQLADNFLKLDQHDHSQGRGTQIPGAGIQPGAITAEHIYPGAISGDALGSGSVGGDQIVDGSITNAKLDANARIPVGTVMDWYCADPTNYSAYVPDGWRVCDGTSVPVGEHEIPGANLSSSFTLPNLINKTTLGADPTQALNTNGTNPGVGYSGGNNTLNLAHSHTVNAHNHGIGAESPGMNNVDLNHLHGVLVASTGDAPVLFGTVTAGVGYSISAAAHPSHTHGGFSGGSLTSDSSISSQTGKDLNHSHTVNSHSHGGATANATPGTNSQLSTVDARSNFIGLLKIMKVKNA